MESDRDIRRPQAQLHCRIPNCAAACEQSRHSDNLAKTLVIGAVELWRRIHDNKSIKLFNREIRKRARVGSTF